MREVICRAGDEAGMRRLDLESEVILVRSVVGLELAVSGHRTPTYEEDPSAFLLVSFLLGVVQVEENEARLVGRQEFEHLCVRGTLGERLHDFELAADERGFERNSAVVALLKELKRLYSVIVMIFYRMCKEGECRRD